MRWITGLVTVAGAVALAACGDNLGAAGGSPDGGNPPDSPDGSVPPPDGGSPDGGPPGARRDQSGGSLVAVEIAGDLAFLAIGPRLSIWQIGAGDAPAPVGEASPLPGVITGLTIAGDRAFVAERVDLAGRIHVIDVSDPARPTETTSFVLARDGFTVPRGMAVLGDRLFVADQEQGVAEVDIADPDAPVLLRIVPHPGVADLKVVGTRLYYIIQSFIGAGAGALDLEADLADLGEFPLSSSAGVAVTPENLVVAAGIDGILVYDFTDPSAPVERFRYTLDEGGPFARAVAASATTAWIPAEDGLHVLDLTRPTAIERTGPFPLTTQGANATAVSGDSVALVTDRGQLILFDVAAEPEERAVADVTLCSDCVGVAAVGERLLVADFFGGIRTADVDDLALIGHSTQPAERVVFEDVAVAGDTAYAADWLFGLRIYDVADPAVPVLVGQVDTAGYPSAVALDGGRGPVYLGESTNGGALRVIDASPPSRAAEIGATPTSQARGLQVRDGLAFVADGSLDLAGGLRIFDVTDPAAIDLVGYYGQDCSEALDVALTGSIAVVACSFDGFHLVDISDPARPVRLAVVPAGGISSAWSVAAWEGGAALGHDFGVILIDLTDPRRPATVASHSTSWTVRAMTATADGRLLAGCGLGGVYQWPLP